MTNNDEITTLKKETNYLLHSRRQLKPTVTRSDYILAFISFTGSPSSPTPPLPPAADGGGGVMDVSVEVTTIKELALIITTYFFQLTPISQFH